LLPPSKASWTIARRTVSNLSRSPLDRAKIPFDFSCRHQRTTLDLLASSVTASLSVFSRPPSLFPLALYSPSVVPLIPARFYSGDCEIIVFLFSPLSNLRNFYWVSLCFYPPPPGSQTPLGDLLKDCRPSDDGKTCPMPLSRLFSLRSRSWFFP